jgi:hypothetical protein
MPYVPAGRRNRAALVAAFVAAFMSVAPAANAKAPSNDVTSAISSWLASTNIDSSSCADPALTQPFQDLGDSANYALAPGQSGQNFTAANWFLTNGAKVQDSRHSDGTNGQVLDLHSGSLALSPPVCLAFNYPTARAMVRTVGGTGGVSVYVVYFSGSSYTVADGGSTNGNGNGNGKAWGLSNQINLQPSTDPGWQIARFALYVPQGAGESQLYNLYIDPYAKR